MSIIKQLWLAIALVVMLAFGMSMAVSIYTNKHYFETQLGIKNNDNTQALALSLSQLDKSPATVELQLNSQFDLGYYKRIEVTSPTGETLFKLVNNQGPVEIPTWFIDMVSLKVPPGVGQVQDGWKQYGTLTVESQDIFAYLSMWHNSQQLLLWFAVGGLLVAALGAMAIEKIISPLRRVVLQARAITERRFEMAPVPRTLELRTVVEAMNHMVKRLQAMFAEDAARLEEANLKLNVDELTQLSNRKHFLSLVKDAMTNPLAPSQGCLATVRLTDLNQLNLTLGHQQTNVLIKGLALMIREWKPQDGRWHLGRVKAGELALLAPGKRDAHGLSRSLTELLTTQWLPQWQGQCPELFQVAVVSYSKDQSMSEVLSTLDNTLAQAMQTGPNQCCHYAGANDRRQLSADQWRELILHAVSQQRVRLAYFDVVNNTDGSLLHKEAMVRIASEFTGELISAADFMPMAAKLGITAEIDLHVTQLALQALATADHTITVNISTTSLAQATFAAHLVRLLKKHPLPARKLAFEVPEWAVVKHFDLFSELALDLQALGCKLGVEQFGLRMTEVNKLAGLGVDHLKVHASFTTDLNDNPGHAAYLKTLCQAAHHMDMAVIALGVQEASEMAALAALGMDGCTGPGIQAKA